MRLIIQTQKIVVRNISDEYEKNLPSNCGKTNILLSLIESPNYVA